MSSIQKIKTKVCGWPECEMVIAYKYYNKKYCKAHAKESTKLSKQRSERKYKSNRKSRVIYDPKRCEHVDVIIDGGRPRTGFEKILDKYKSRRSEAEFNLMLAIAGGE